MRPSGTQNESKAQGGMITVWDQRALYLESAGVKGLPQLFQSSVVGLSVPTLRRNIHYQGDSASILSQALLRPIWLLHALQVSSLSEASQIWLGPCGCTAAAVTPYMHSAR